MKRFFKQLLFSLIAVSIFSCDDDPTRERDAVFEFRRTGNDFSDGTLRFQELSNGQMELSLSLNSPLSVPSATLKIMGLTAASPGGEISPLGLMFQGDSFYEFNLGLSIFSGIRS